MKTTGSWGRWGGGGKDGEGSVLFMLPCHILVYMTSKYRIIDDYCNCVVSLFTLKSNTLEFTRPSAHLRRSKSNRCWGGDSKLCGSHNGRNPQVEWRIPCNWNCIIKISFIFYGRHKHWLHSLAFICAVSAIMLFIPRPSSFQFHSIRWFSPFLFQFRHFSTMGRAKKGPARSDQYKRKWEYEFSLLWMKRKY